MGRDGMGCDGVVLDGIWDGVGWEGMVLDGMGFDRDWTTFPSLVPHLPNAKS